MTNPMSDKLDYRALPNRMGHWYYKCDWPLPRIRLRTFHPVDQATNQRWLESALWAELRSTQK
ncbi:hypothetical protein LCGC14_0827840 [marine sediment metagenome]|uniref:Uncharacterized protein n=1 Tax=marine sediment metagenome TaxID=412755 RepID=A0A0F9PLH8_9ZZZZ